MQELDLQPNDKVLEVGTGSGYLTALMASLAGYVYSVEIKPQLAESARARLDAQGVSNVTIEVGDASQGWPRHGPYDGIVITGSVPTLADSFKESLATGGRLVAIVGGPPVMEAVLVRRIDETGWSTCSLFDCSIAPLVNAVPEPTFVF